jgi:hypothetical protein
MHQKHRGRVPRAFIDVTDAEVDALAAGNCHVVGGVREVGQSVETVVRRAKHLHRGILQA